LRSFVEQQVENAKVGREAEFVRKHLKVLLRIKIFIRFLLPELGAYALAKIKRVSLKKFVLLGEQNLSVNA
jgi:hypothetical protein